MRCPYCNSTESQVRDSRPNEEDGTIRRRRVCSECGAKFTTIERVQLRDIMVRKTNGTLQSFDREKLARSIRVACRKRDIPEEQIEKFVTSIHRRLEAENDESVSSEQIGEMVSESLLNLDPIAFIRFASVYKKFNKISDFQKIIGKIQDSTENEKKSESQKKYKTSLF
ncbi:MAG: transcriptional repressor NrdR [Alphaproteobacteria bacterium]|nr:transcriptional repressor NrdR [Alphaproteobacteria bacterium]